MPSTRNVFEDPASLNQELRILDGIANWCGALHGSMSLDEALGTLAQAVSASHCALSRDARSGGKPRIVAQYDFKKSSCDIDPLHRAFAPDVLDKYYGKVRTGSACFLSEHQDDRGFEETDGLALWRLSRSIVDIVVVCLESTGVQQDYLEFHFADVLGREKKKELEESLPTLVRAWAGRKTGLVTQAKLHDRIVQARVAAKTYRLKPDVPLLGASNPAKLSRAEFRVCLLLARGLSIKGLTDELGLCESTIRSHLRSIYSKTETSGLPGLVYRLLTTAESRSQEYLTVGRF